MGLSSIRPIRLVSWNRSTSQSVSKVQNHYPTLDRGRILWGAGEDRNGQVSWNRSSRMQANMTCPCRLIALKIAVSLCVLGAIVSDAQRPTKAREAAIRSACQTDFASH